MEALRIKKMRPDAVVPRRATPGSAGIDLCACLEQPLTLRPGAHALIPTGIAIGLPDCSFVGLIFARSGLSVKHGISLINSVGVIDSDYTGELQVGLINLYAQPYTIQPGERVAQLAVLPVACLPVLEVDELDKTQRGAGGFGSTGRI